MLAFLSRYVEDDIECREEPVPMHRERLLRRAVRRVHVSCLDRRFGSAGIFGLVWNPAKASA